MCTHRALRLLGTERGRAAATKGLRYRKGTGAMVSWDGMGRAGHARAGLEVFIIQSERRSVFEMAGATKTAGRGLTDAAPPPPNIALALTSLRQQGEIR